MRKRFSIKELKDGIRLGDTLHLSKGITLVESELEHDQQMAEELVNELLPYTGNSFRIAITGVPGAGKSTFIEALGSYLTSLNKKVAVLAVDPSSGVTKGSILGDKTRMEELSKNDLAFIRPSPTGKSVSGITKSTRQSILLCEAAGYEVILIETVGVGQVETMVHNMVDLLLLVTITGAGDELQMIKKGILELAEIIIVNKADGLNSELAIQTAREMAVILKEFKESSPDWNTKVLPISSTEKKGIDSLWKTIEDYFSNIKANGFYNQNRANQNTVWMNEAIGEILNKDFYNSVAVQNRLKALQTEVEKGLISSQSAARNLVEIFRKEQH